MHLKRIITALIGIPLLVIIIAFGNRIVFALLILVVSLVALYEYCIIVLNKSKDPVINPISIISFISAPIILVGAYYSSFFIVYSALLFNLFFSCLLSLKKFKTDITILNSVAKQIQGTIYIPVLQSTLIIIRNSDNGINFIFLVLLIVASCDSGAFYAGLYLGKHKLIPWISPKKTVEGLIGGLIAAVIIGSVYKSIALPELSWPLSIIFILCIGLSGLLGDLFESMLKRVGNIKDSGFILPGHGGILDRIDALLFACPVAFLFKFFIF